MRILAAVIFALIALPCQAQVQEVTSERIAFALPDGSYDYSRDIIALKDSAWAQENVQLAFMLSGEVQVPPMASDSLIQALNAAINDALAREDAAIARADSLAVLLSDTRAERDSYAEKAREYDALYQGVQAAIRLLNRE